MSGQVPRAAAAIGAILILDQDGLVRDIDPSAATLLRRRPEDVLDHPLRTLCHRDDHEDLDRLVGACLADAEPRQSIIRAIHPDERVVTLRLTGRRATLHGRHVVLVALSAAGDEAGVAIPPIAEHLPAAFWIRSVADWHTLFVSRDCERIWGLPREQMVGPAARWDSALHGDDGDQVRAARSAAVASGAYALACRIVRPEGGVRWIEERGALVPDESGRARWLVGVSEDVTERRSAEAALREAKSVAEAADQAKSAFLAAMTHELRTPLTAIVGFGELLEDDGGALTERQRRYVGHVLSSGRALLELVDQVLDIARMEVGGLRVAPAPVDLSQLLGDIMSLVRPLAGRHDITLAETVPGALPRIDADAPKLKQVVFGLLANAVRHTPDGGRVALTARIMADGAGMEPGAWVEIAVADSGPGIRPEDRERLMNAFTLVDAGRVPLSRSGMSLALARKLVELHGGRMWLENGDAGGTVVRFVLPVDAGRPAVEEPTGRGEDPAAPLVLVIEDDPIASDVLALYLQEGGYRVARAVTAAQGLAMVRDLAPDAITLDPALPDRDGIDMLSDLRRDGGGRDIPVVVVSVSVPRPQAAEHGIAAWLVKPVDRDELLGVLRRGSGGAAAHRTGATLAAS